MTYTIEPEQMQAASRPAVQHVLNFACEPTLWDCYAGMSEIGNHVSASGLTDWSQATLSNLGVQPDGSLTGTVTWTW